MAEKLKPFRWLGTPGVGGSLMIRSDDAKTVRLVPPAGPTITKSCIVRDQAELEALGAKRIKEIVESGAGEYVNLVEGVMDAMAKEPDSSEKKDAKDATSIAKNAAEEALEAEKRAKAGRDLRDKDADASTAGTLAPEGQRQDGIVGAEANKSPSAPPATAPADGAGPK